MVSLVNPGPAAAAKPASGRLFAFSALMAVLVVVFIAGMWMLIRSDYKRSVAEAQLQLSHISELFEQSVEASLNLANLRMWGLIDRIAEAPELDTATLDGQYGDVLNDAVEDIPQIDSLVIIGPEGTVVWSTARGLLGRDLSDRGYYQKASQLGRGEYSVGIPIISRGTGRRLTPVAWPLLDPGGGLRGVVASSLGESYFERLLTLTGVQSDMLVSIVTENGDTAFVSNANTSLDGEEIFEASTDVPALGVTINVKRSRATVLAGFRQRSIVFAVTAAVLFFTAIGAAIRSQIKSIQLAQSLARSQRDKQRILAAQKEFEAIFENVADGIVIFDEDDQLVRSNKKARELLDSDGDKPAAARLRELLPPVSGITEVFSVHRIELPHLSNDQSEQAVQCRVMRLTHHDQTIFYCVLADISAEERLTSARAGFITSVNHELRTPLTSLAGSLEVLSERFGGDLPVGASRLVAMASRNADRLLMLVNDILTLQAIDQEQLTVQMEPVPVSEVLREAVAANSGYGLGAEVRLVCDTPGAGAESYIFADRMRVQQIFSNLISNAMKYSPRSGEVRIGAGIEDGKVRFRVRDRGPGIPAAARDRIYQRFTKPVHSKEVQASGTGLGLAITKELADRQGAAIDFESVTVQEDPVNCGTTFRITFDELAPEEIPARAAS